VLLLALAGAWKSQGKSLTKFVKRKGQGKSLTKFVF
jgi:hypothetical protein